MKIPEEERILNKAVDTVARPNSAIVTNAPASKTTRPEKLTEKNLKRFERQAPGPADLFPEPVFCTKKVSIAPLPTSKPRVEQEPCNPIMLYPKVDVIKPNHSPKVIYRKEHKLRSSAESVISDRQSINSIASTAPTSTLSKSAVTIAPLQYSKLTDRQLEILLRK